MKKVTYLGGQVGDQAWKFGRHWVKAGLIGDPTGHNVEPWDECDTFSSFNNVLLWFVLFSSPICVVCDCAHMLGGSS